jgi:hypothetical protein
LKHLRDEIENNQKDNNRLCNNYNIKNNINNDSDSNMIIYNNNNIENNDIEGNYDVVSNILSVLTEISHITIETSKIKLIFHNFKII